MRRTERTAKPNSALVGHSGCSGRKLIEEIEELDGKWTVDADIRF